MNEERERYKQIAEALKMVAHPDRLKIIDILKKEELSVNEIKDKLEIKQSIVSQHLNNMKNKKILTSRREGNHVYYSIINKEFLNIIECIKRCEGK